MRVLGFDVGSSGSSVLLDPRPDGGRPTLLLAVTWTPQVRGGLRCWRVGVWTPDGQSVQVEPSQGRVGGLVAKLVPRAAGIRFGVWYEEAVVRRNVRAALLTSYRAGTVVGPVERYAPDAEAQRVKATEWRKLLLGDPYSRGKRASERAKEASLLLMPGRIVGLPEALADLSTLLGQDQKKMHHLTDASGVAEYGEQRWIASQG